MPFTHDRALSQVDELRWLLTSVSRRLYVSPKAFPNAFASQPCSANSHLHVHDFAVGFNQPVSHLYHPLHREIRFLE